MYLTRQLIQEPGVEIVGVRVGSRKADRVVTQDLGWPVLDIDLGRFSVSTLFRRQIYQFQSMVSDVKPDLIHAHGSDAAGFLAVKSRQRAVVTVHGVLSECAKYHTDPVRRIRDLLQSRLTERYVIGRANHILAISPYVARYYGNLLRGTIHNVPNPVAQSFFDVRRNPTKGRVLFAGRISVGKGLLDLVRAVSRIPDAVERVVMAGSVPEREFESRLRYEIGESGLANRFEFVGLLNETALLEEFARAAVLVLPSYQETAPMVIQQAMAARVPVVATSVGGVPDMIEDKISGLLVNPGDVEGLASALQRIAIDSDLPEMLSTAARAKAERLFRADQVAKATLKVYQRVLSD
jgi:glycosyltransferase involved in cell wall biosynthesis